MTAATAPRDIRARDQRLRFGIVTPPMWRSWNELLDLWTRAEQGGFDIAFLARGHA
jgi:alkanesulfonate monooxygenase SsuD/methylene tetrahydromethanopterin reductase-like flavin-dependent oxidoreductase (luciferase family)